MLRATFLRRAAAPYFTMPQLVKPADGSPITLPELTFDINDGCAPVFSKRQMELHYGKHHKAYVDRMNSLLEGTKEHNGKPIEEIALAAKDKKQQVLFNQAAQHFNHSFFWRCLRPATRGERNPIPDGVLLKAVEKSFESPAGFFAKFEQSAVGNFGSGWTWLVVDAASGELRIVNTSNAEMPDTGAQGRPILTADVWEHAYYKDFENRRPDYIHEFWSVVNWKFVQECYERARS
eukprot:PhM_4_TR12936/c0_g1_i1/m.25430/K04564/SOD2; superoxide dismutase, Fe-Mn family